MATSRDIQTGSEGPRRNPDYNVAAEDANRIKEKLAGATEEAKQRGKARLEEGKDVAADQAERLAQAADTAAAGLGDQDPTLANYASQLAAGMHRFAENLRHRSINELAADTQALARRNPTLFLLGSVALGVALSRFMKASSERSRREEEAAASGYPPGESALTGEAPVTPGSAPLSDSTLGTSTGSGGSYNTLTEEHDHGSKH